ncbi:hypothetical protein KPH14_004951 [Odynerus spinipes]|uniref:Hydroxylysine kinase n=1 Tax=Odynerus spinipes TaxID=1348599 RepID=A0AAD9VQT6_9HYME|nr:hypothetical protein KPH14_004951 [Odynerus spinipes]
MENNDTLLSPGQRIRPHATIETASDLLEKIYGLTAVNIYELNAYDDKNYHVYCKKSEENPHIPIINEHGYVLKIINSLDSRKTDVIEAQTKMLIFLNRYFACPVPVKTLAGTYYSLEKLTESGETHAVRLLIYRPGQLLTRVSWSQELLYKIGRFTAEVDLRLSGFYHPAYEHHRTMWMLVSVPKLRRFVFAVKDENREHLANEVIDAFEREVLKIVPNLAQGIIHGDLNEQNILVNPEGTDIVAVIDFGDSQKTCLVFELAIVICYMLLERGEIGAGKHVIEGYQSTRKLTDLEKKVLRVSVCARICQSLVMGAYSHFQDPQNNYLLITQKTGWTLLQKLWPMSEEEISRVWNLSSPN